MEFTAVVKNVKLIRTDIPAIILNSADIFVFLNGNKHGFFPYIGLDGKIELRFSNPIDAGILKVEVRFRQPELNEYVNEATQRQYINHSLNTNDKLITTLDKNFKLVNGEAILDLQAIGIYFTRNKPIELAGKPIVYDFELSTDILARIYKATLLKREVSDYTGLYDYDTVIGLEEGGLHILRYGFDPNSARPRLIHSLTSPPKYMTVDNTLVEFTEDNINSFRDGYYYAGVDVGSVIRLFNEFDEAIPIRYRLPKRLV